MPGRMNAEGSRMKELQSYFVKRVAKMIQRRGRKAMGWTRYGGRPCSGLR